MIAKAATDFDYGDLPSEKVTELKGQAVRLRNRMKASVAEVFAIGREFIEAKAALGERFRDWVDEEVGVPLSSIRDWMNAAQRFGRCHKIAESGFSLAALYDLARPSVEPAARREAIDRAKSGERIDRHKAADIIARNRVIPADEPPPAAPPADRVPLHAGVYFATRRSDGENVVVLVRDDGIPHFRAFVPGERKGFNLTEFTDYSPRIVDPRRPRGEGRTP